MALWSPAPRRDSPKPEPEVLARAGLAPGQIVEFIRSAGYRAQPELVESGIRIDTGVAGYVVSVNCFSTKALNESCSSVQLFVGMTGDENIPVAKVRMFVNDFNNKWRYVKAATNASGDYFISLDFIVDATTTTTTFASYFSLWESLLQNLRQQMGTEIYL